MLVERVEGKPVEKKDPYIELQQYLGSIILPIRKSIRNNIYWKSKHAPRMLGEAMKKAEELYMKHIYTTGKILNKRENVAPTEITINEVDSPQRTRDYTHRHWRNRESSEISPNQPNFRNKPGRQGEAARSRPTEAIFREDIDLHRTKKIDSSKRPLHPNTSQPDTIIGQGIRSLDGKVSRSQKE